jgi:hypothetical protein
LTPSCETRTTISPPSDLTVYYRCQRAKLRCKEKEDTLGKHPLTISIWLDGPFGRFDGEAEAAFVDGPANVQILKSINRATPKVYIEKLERDVGVSVSMQRIARWT